MKTLLMAGALALFPFAATAQPAPPSLTAERCAKLASFTLDRKAIGLPTKGAHVTSARSVTAAATTPAYCLVSGEIAAVDPTAPAIRFQVALPMTWNSKALGIGGGGFNGSVPPITSAQYAGSPTAVPPLTRGYAIFASDSGHQETGLSQGMFMQNAEALDNYLGSALKKTRDTAMAIVAAAYGHAPTRSYFFGGSTGGREALWVAGRWPKDWDGVVAFYPARDLTTLTIGMQTINRALARPGGYLSPAKRGALYGAALETCDGLDGLKDGIISDVAGCNARFVPARASYKGKPLRCPGGKDTGDDCLSDPQLDTIAVIQNAQRVPYPLASGITEFPGFNAYTSDLGIGTSTPSDQALLFFGLGAIPPGFPAKPGMSLGALYLDSFVRFGWVGDPSVNPLTFDSLHPGKYAARISAMSKVDSSDRDLSAFAARGGKLLILHGAADMVVSPRETEHYVMRLRERMGSRRVDGFLRFYEVPAFSHGVGNRFNAGWDYLTALENWVEKARDPGEHETVADATGVPGRTRPLCQFPRWAKYNGTGDANAATSFSCVGAKQLD